MDPSRRPWVVSGDQERREARDPHDLTYLTDEEPDKLATLAPHIFMGGGGTAVLSQFGQTASLLLDSVARIPTVNGPAHGKTFGTHAVSPATQRRWWLNTLAVVGAQPASWQVASWPPQERGAFLWQLRKIRSLASSAQLTAFELLDTDSFAML